MLEEFQKYLKNIESNQIEKYTDVDIADEDFVTGSRSTQFARCSTELFTEFVEEIKNNPNCSYESYVNDLIKSGYVPEFVSIAVQKTYFFSEDLTQIDNFKDVCSSRIMNFFECPTIYVQMLKNKDKEYVCSLDFNKYGEDFYSFSEIGCSYGGDSFLEDHEQLSAMLDMFEPIQGFENYEAMKDQLLQQHAYSYFLRRYILRDWDGNLYNMGMVVDKEHGTFQFAPNFDFEYTFDRVFVPRLWEGKLREYYEWHQNFAIELESLNKIYPTVYQKFVTKFKEFIDTKDGKPTYANIIEKEIGDGEIAEDFVCDYGNYLNELDDMLTMSLV